MLLIETYHSCFQMTQDKETDKEATGPKHGQTDPQNAPHVGGNMWAGGTGKILAHENN